MIDNFALALTHGLLILAAWRLLPRNDLDDVNAPEPAPPSTKGSGRLVDTLKKVRPRA